LPTAQSFAQGYLSPPLDKHIPVVDLKTSTNSIGPFPKAYEFRPLSSSQDFFSQLKDVLGNFFRALLTFVAEQLDPLLDNTILVENFAQTKSSERPNIHPVNSLLNEALAAFQRNFVHLTLSQQFFSEVFGRINSHLMNGVLLRCSRPPFLLFSPTLFLLFSALILKLLQATILHCCLWQILGGMVLIQQEFF
jgi:hypothetical protein